MESLLSYFGSDKITVERKYTTESEGSEPDQFWRYHDDQFIIWHNQGIPGHQGALDCQRDGSSHSTSTTQHFQRNDCFPIGNEYFENFF